MTRENHESMIFRFKGLIHAIEFFSQRFDHEQIINYAFDFVEELLIVDKVAVFVEKEGYYVPVKTRGYNITGYQIEATTELRDIVVLHAGLFYEDDLKQLFPSSLSEQFGSKLAIPLIIDRSLYGFILIGRADANKSFDEDDVVFATALMNLYYTALTNYQSYDELIKVKRTLDEKIFTLFAINQSSKVLLGTLDIDKICNLSVSVFSELTQSSITSIFIYDEMSENYRMMAIQNVYQFDHQSNLIAIQMGDLSGLCMNPYYDMSIEADRDKFVKAFHNAEILLGELNPTSLIPLAKNDHLLGFITLGKRVNGEVYNDSVVELIEGLASSLYVSISNAKQVNIIQEQKTIIDSKLQSLTTLNHLIKNINCSSSLSNMFTIVAQTLELSLKVKCGMIAEYNTNSDELIAVKKINCENISDIIPLDSMISRLRSGKRILANSIYEANELFGKSYMSNIEGEYSGAIVLPVYIDNFDADLLGVMIIFDIEDQIISNHVNPVMFESMANAIAPIWYQLKQMAYMKENYIVNGTTSFERDFRGELEMARDFDLDLHIMVVTYNASHFLDRAMAFGQLSEEFKKTYKIDNGHMIILSNIIDEYERLEMMIPDDYEIKCYSYRKDFEDYASFVALI